MKSRRERRAVALGLAVIAVSLAENLVSDEVARETLLDTMARFGARGPSILTEAVRESASLPQPTNDPRRDQIYQRFGLATPTAQLAANLRAREWLARLADDLEAAEA